jgi:hypothetical protein
MTKALREIKEQGSMTITSELLRELSPYRTAHIGRFGVYELRDRNVANLEYDFKFLESTDGEVVI